jgi:hypothetical protein
MSEHPYKAQPKRAFWSKGVAAGFTACDLISGQEPIFREGDKVMSAGSCFAANLVPYLEQAGFSYLRTELPHAAFAELPENFTYRSFTAAYGNIYTARQMRQLLDRSLGLFRPAEDRWHVGPHVIDPYRPGLRYPARSDAEFDLLTAQHLRAVKAAFEQCTVFVFTLGLTEAWVSALDGAVFPACPGTVSGEFDSNRHIFHNFTAGEVSEDLRALIFRLRQVNPSVRIVLTVSPVPLVATATSAHVLAATIYSKSALRTAAGEVCATEPGVTYFPAYEIVTGPQAPYEYFEADRRNVSKAAVDAVMAALLSHPQSGAKQVASTDVQTATSRSIRPSSPVSSQTVAPQYDPATELSSLIAEAECEEAMVDVVPGRRPAS